MTLHNVLQAVIDNYPSVEGALIQVERARLNTGKAQAQLGWLLQAQGGINREASLFGSATDTISAGGSLSRQLDSGSTLAVDASIGRSDSEQTFPGVSNPSTTTSVGVSFRQPLGRGADNPAYEQSLIQAELDVADAEAQRSLLYDQLAEQVIGLYAGALNIRSQQQNVRQAIDRSQRRQRYLEDRTELGVSEEQDLLQVDAQLKSQLAQLRALDVTWQTQRIQLNRLIGRPSDSELNLIVLEDKLTIEPVIAEVRRQAIENDAELAQIETRLLRADSFIELTQDADEDQFDLVLSIGNQSQSGDSGSGSESTLTGGVNLEYQQAFDKRASKAEIDQALLDKDAALVDKRRILEDIEYDSATLVAEILSGRDALRAYQASIDSERAKLREAESRYRKGRSDTEQLLNFESQLSQAELSFELQRIELLKDQYSLELLSGDLWRGIDLPGSAEE